MGTQAALMTFAEFEKLPDPRSGHLELHHGEVVFAPHRIKSHVKIQRILEIELKPLEQYGFLSIELPFRPAAEYESWQCDLGFISQARWDADHNDHFLGAPDFIIEVLSKSNRIDEMLDRQEMCFANGCTCFWMVVPKQQVVLVTRPDGTTFKYDRSSSVPLPEPYGGSIPVASICRQ